MRKFLVMFCAAAMMFVSANVANACTQQDPGCPTGSTPTVWTDTVEKTIFFSDRLPGVNSAQIFHSIIDEGFVPLVDKSLSIALAFTFSDDYDNYWDWYESVNISTSGVSQLFPLSFDFAPTMSLSGSAFFDATGTLTVNLMRTAGDFYFKKSVMTVTGCDFSTVPEPATLLLLGGGLIGLVGYGRKKISK